MEKFFKLRENGTNVKTEVFAGITTFFAMAYILFVNPSILSDPYYIQGMGEKAAEIQSAVFVATCIGAIVGTMLMALLAKLPFAQAPGMGLNAFFAYTVCLSLGYTYEQGLALVFISGIFFMVITLIGLRTSIVHAIPEGIKLAMTAGIGLFIAFIGLQKSGIIVNNEATLVALFNFADPLNRVVILSTVCAFLGLILIGVLYKFKVKASILIGILFTTLAIYVVNTIFGTAAVDPITGVVATVPYSLDSNNFNHLFDTPAFSTWLNTGFMAMDFKGLFEAGDGNVIQNIFAVLMIVITFLLVDMFDTIGTLFGTAKQNDMLDENGDLPNMKKALICDSVATTVGAMVGTSSVTTYVESSAGMAQGGKTGLTSLVTGCLFIVAMFFAPIMGLIPIQATAPALIFVGCLMLGSIKNIDFGDITDTIPIFLTIILMPLTYSIANGIAFGLISYVLLKLCTGKVKQINPITAIIAAVFVLRYALI